MYVSLLPGATSDDLFDRLGKVRTDLGNLSGAQYSSANDRRNDYIRWVNNSVSQLRHHPPARGAQPALHDAVVLAHPHDRRRRPQREHRDHQGRARLPQPRAGGHPQDTRGSEGAVGDTEDRHPRQLDVLRARRQAGDVGPRRPAGAGRARAPARHDPARGGRGAGPSQGERQGRHAAGAPGTPRRSSAGCCRTPTRPAS